MGKGWGTATSCHAVRSRPRRCLDHPFGHGLANKGVGLGVPPVVVLLVVVGRELRLAPEPTGIHRDHVAPKLRVSGSVGNRELSRRDVHGGPNDRPVPVPALAAHRDANGQSLCPESGPKVGDEVGKVGLVGRRHVHHMRRSSPGTSQPRPG